MLDSKDSKYVAWRQSDCAVKTWMLNALEPEIAASVGLASTAKEMWDSIKKMFLMMVTTLVYSLCFNSLLITSKGRSLYQNFFAAYS